MWQDTKDGIAKEFITRQKETVLFEIKRKAGLGVVNRDGFEQIIFGVRDGQIKIWNDMLFDAATNDQIKSKMDSLIFSKARAAKR